MNGFDAGVRSIEQAQDIYLNGISGSKSVPELKNGQETFRDILNKVSAGDSELRFSKHANARLQSRNINLSNEQLNRLNDGVNKARSKSINESLVMMDDMAFIVNVKNNTVVTALDQSNDSVFTNIDGAVIV